MDNTKLDNKIYKGFEVIKKSIMIICSVLCFENFTGATNYKQHKYREKTYQHVWCLKHGGIEEYRNFDKTKVDCLTETHAIEFDFAKKWAESIGQALYYAYVTKRKPKIVLILENPAIEIRYFEKIQNLSKIYNFDVEFVTPEFLNFK